MSRYYVLSEVSFLQKSVIMESFVDPWGESDTLLGDVSIRGFYDEDRSLAYWCYFASKVPSDEWMMVDVGAYSGLWSLLGARFLSHGSVVALEASPVTYSRLVKNVLLNSLDVTIVAANYAVTDKLGDVVFKHLYGVYTTCSGDSVSSNETENSSNFDHVSVVRGIFLDILKEKPSSRPGVLGSPSTNLSKSDRVHAVKIDVEGHERNVLQGMQRILEDDRPFIICEILSNESLGFCRDFLGKYKYNVFDIPNERNFLFIPAERSLLIDEMGKFIATYDARLRRRKLVSIGVTLSADRSSLLRVREHEHDGRGHILDDSQGDKPMEPMRFDAGELQQIVNATQAVVEELDSIKRSRTYRLAKRLRGTFPGRVVAKAWKLVSLSRQIYVQTRSLLVAAKQSGLSVIRHQVPELSTRMNALVRPVRSGYARLRVVGRSPNSQGAELWILAAKNSKGFVELNSINLYGTWSVREGLGYQGRLALVCSRDGWADIPYSDDTRVMLLRHPWSGVVEICSNGRCRRFDLYKAQADHIIVSLTDLEVKDRFPPNESSARLNVSFAQNESSLNAPIAVVNPDWRGIYSSTKNLFDYVLEIPDNLDEESGLSYARILAETGGPVVVIQGFPHSYHHLVMSLRRLAPKIRIAVLWHGTFLQHHYDFDWQSFRSIDRLYREGIIWKVGFVKQRMAEVMANRGIRTGFVRNFVRDIPERPSDPLPGGLHFGMWFLYSGPLKNQLTMLAAISTFSSSKVHISGVDERLIEFIRFMEIGSHILDKPVDQQLMKFHLSQMHLNLYVTLTECAPMLPLESLSVGVPCLMGPSNYYFDDHDYLRERLIVPQPDDAGLIAHYMQRALEERSDIIAAYKKFAPDYNRLAMQSLADFVELDLTPQRV